jgi:signal transduction histidine kinase
VLWAGTTAGLAFRSGERFQIPGGAPASLRAQILGIAEDAEGWFWIATSNQVLRVRRDKLLDGILREGDLREYRMEDGLRGVEGVRRHQSVFRDTAGRIWFSLNRGISVVDPARLASTSAPVPVHIQTLSADGGAVDLTGPVHVPGGRRRITFGYAGISLSVAERVRYRYRLDNFERDWNGPVAGREAAYTNVGPGSYRFRVMASNSDGVWSGNETTIPFVVDPLFWQTWWFLAGVSAALGITVVSLYRLRLHQMTRRLNRRFEERLAERMRIAQELHDTLLQGFISASMQLYVATDRLPPDSRVRPSLNNALELVRRVIEEGRNAVRGLRSSHRSSPDLEQAFSRVGDEFAASEPNGKLRWAGRRQRTRDRAIVAADSERGDGE